MHSEKSYIFKAVHSECSEEFLWLSRGYKFTYQLMGRPREHICIGEKFKVDKIGNHIDLLSIDPHSFSLLEDVSHVKKLTITNFKHMTYVHDRLKLMTRLERVRRYSPFLESLNPESG